MDASRKASADLGQVVRRTAVDPYRFAELVAAWNAEFDPEDGRHVSIPLDAAADAVIERMVAAAQG